MTLLDQFFLYVVFLVYMTALLFLLFLESVHKMRLLRFYVFPLELQITCFRCGAGPSRCQRQTGGSDRGHLKVEPSSL